jgi:hypothetical protein
MTIDIACIIQQVFDLPRTSKDQLMGTLIMNHINNENLAEMVDLRNNHLRIFRDEYQRKIGGKNKKLPCLYFCPRNELPPQTEPGTKWYANMMHMERLHAGYYSRSRPSRVEKKGHTFNDIKENLL